MSRILITRSMPGRVVEAAREAGEVTYRDETTPMTRDEMVAALGEFDAVLTTLGDGWSGEVFAAAGKARCKVLANFGVGYNHIDVSAARAAGITVTNTPGAVTDATADLAMTLILMTARRAGEGERLVRAGAWGGWHPVQMLGLHVTGKRLGVIGMGRIGQAIARRCHFGFGMEIGYVARSDKTLDYPATRHESLGALAAASDIVVTAVPGGAETHHMVGTPVFEAMPDHGIFVNIARGDVVDEAALIAALEARRIAGAGLDVYEFEPEVPEALKALDNVVLLPHLGTAALEVREAMGLMALDNLRAVLDGEDAPNAV